MKKVEKFWQGKKIVAFIALKHHTRFILPITRRLEKLGAEVLFIIGQGENPQELTAMEYDLNYRHVFDYLTSDDTEAYIENYHIQREKIAEGLREDSSLARHETTVIDRSILSAAKEYVGFRNLVRSESPDLCLALHELNRWGKILGFWAKKYNVPFVTLQEGLYYGQDIGLVGHVQFTTLNLLWGESTRRKLSRFEAPLDRIIPVGNTHLTHEIEHLKKHDVRGKMREKYGCNGAFVTLLFLPPTPPPSAEYAPILEYIAGTKQQRLFLKWHPIAKKGVIEEWEKGLPRRAGKRILSIHGDESPYALMAMSDLCVLTVPSTTGIEALAIGRPLVQLQLKDPPDMPYSFVEKGAAIPMTPEELVRALESGARFDGMMDRPAVSDYLKEELHDTEGVVERIEDTARMLIRSNKRIDPVPLEAETEINKDFSMVIPVSPNPAVFLAQMRAIEEHSSAQGSYEVLLLEEETLPEDVLQILEGLGGDVGRVVIPGGKTLWEVMDSIAVRTTGERLIFLGPYGLAPMDGWLSGIREAMQTHGERKVFGGIVRNGFGSIVHAGMILNPNHSPVSAYEHLGFEYPNALKERPFLLLDYFLAMKRRFFLELGGLCPESGRYCFMDLCLRARARTNDPGVAVYLPGVPLLQLEERPEDPDQAGAVSFYGRWHGTLWDNEDALYTQDSVSRAEVQTLLMKRLVELAKTGTDG